jgi:hypothetical protein
MDKTQKIAFIFSALIIIAGIFVFIYLTYLRGNNFGPSFIEDINSKKISSNDIESIEFISLPIGHDSFTNNEYSKLTRRRIISDPDGIKNFIDAMIHEIRKGRIHQNHPATIYQSYIRINVSGENFYYLYVHILRDSKSYVVYIDANSLGSTNLNGAQLYRNNKFLKVIKKYDFKNLQQNI